MRNDRLYEDYIQMLGSLEEDTLSEADKRLSEMEDEHPELLQEAEGYYAYISGKEGESINVCVLGGKGHALAHLIDSRNSNSVVYWMVNPEHYDISYDAHMDFVVFYDDVVQEMLDDDQFMATWLRALKSNGVIICRKPEQLDLSQIYNIFAIRGCRLLEINKNGICTGQKVICPKEDTVIPRRYKTVYVICPAWRKSGGPELCHQLVYWINHLSGDAKIAYVSYESCGTLCHPEYLDYVAGHIIHAEEIEDDYENAVVVPEGWGMEITRFTKAKIMLWWMSVDNYIQSMGTSEYAEEVLPYIDKSVDQHLVQSMYAEEYLTKNGIDCKKICHLGDYLNHLFLSHTEDTMLPKKDLVLYNPLKGSEYVRELMKAAPDIPWKAIEGLTTDEANALMRDGKVYIDFGNHPGKDRIPREAAMSGCVVITGKRGSAANGKDVAIPEKYKLAETEHTYEEVVCVIRDALENYESLVHDFDDYRAGILSEKEEFTSDIRRIFFDSLNE